MAENYKMKPEAVIKELREAAHLTQAELAEQIECSEQTISNIECGKYLSPDKAIKIARFFRVPPDYILGVIDNPDEYRNMIIKDISLMSQTVKAQETLVEYLTVSEGNRKIKLSEAEKQSLMNEIMWYGRVRLQKIIREKSEKNGKETK